MQTMLDYRSLLRGATIDSKNRYVPTTNAATTKITADDVMNAASDLQLFRHNKSIFRTDRATVRGLLRHF